MIIGDSAYPPATYPTTVAAGKVEGWGFYIGGDTPHVWSDAEVAELKHHYTRLLPIYTRSAPQGPAQGTADGKAAVARAMALGVPHGSAIMFDLETAVNAGYCDAAQYEIEQGGYVMIDYGSASTVTGNPRPAGGYDEADWTDTDPGPKDTGVQYENTPTDDLNDFRDDTPVWNIAATAPAPKPPAPPVEEEIEVIIIDAPRSAEAGAERDMWLMGNGKYIHILSDPLTYPNLSAKLPVIIVDYSNHAQWLAEYGVQGL